MFLIERSNSFLLLLILVIGHQRASAQGIIQTVAGGALWGVPSSGPAVSAPLGGIGGVAVDGLGNVFATDTDNNLVVKVSRAGFLTVVAGNGSAGFSGDGGPATNAALNLPFGVAVDGAGNVYISDSLNSRIRKVNTAGIISTIAGTGSNAFSGDGGPAASASLWQPHGVAVDAVGNLVIADTGNLRIRRVSSSGTITTIAGIGSRGFSGDGGLATSASLSGPQGVAVDASGNLYIVDAGNQRIRKVNAAAMITTVAGNGKTGFSGDGGLATNASLNLNAPEGVAVDSAGNLFIADALNDRIRKVDTSGLITTAAGNGAAAFSGDGGLATSSSLAFPCGVAVDAIGNQYH
jgi:sugar lactone lactonase YvrE